MPDIIHQFPVAEPPEKVFPVIATPAGLDAWWTLTSQGEPELGTRYRLGFGPEHQWFGVVREVDPPRRLVLDIVEADDDWTGTQLHFTLEPNTDGTTVRFAHTGWRSENDHFRSSSYCWAMYLRVLKRYIERGEEVPYADRFDP